MRTLVAAALAFLLAGTVRAEEPPPPWYEPDARELLAGVGEIGIPGIPGLLSVFGDRSFPVVEAESAGRPAPVVAAGFTGKGRVVAFAHNGYFGAGMLKTAGTGTLVENAARWTAAKSEPTVGIRQQPGVRAYLKDAGFVVRPLDGADWTRALDGIDTLFAPATSFSSAELELVDAFLQKGGGLVTGHPGWGWQQLNPAKDLSLDNPANRLLAKYGIVFGRGLIKKPKEGRLPAAVVPSLLLHAGLSIDALMSTQPLEARQRVVALSTLSRCAGDLPPTDPIVLPQIRAIANAAYAVPRADKPLTDTTGLAKVALALRIRDDTYRKPDEITAHPAAAHFPGAVPASAERVTTVVAVNPAVPNWQSTGLYAPAGEVVIVSIPEAATRVGLRLRIGAHTDRLWTKKAWRRAPDISRSWPLDRVRTKAASAFGGLVYVEVPKKSGGLPVAVQIEGAVESPWYVAGSTSLKTWRNDLRERPGPWAELQTDKVVITIPSTFVRELDDPGPLMAFWDEVLDACADLATIPRERERPERYVADEQISAGYMHAGYPIMTHLDAAPRFVDRKTLSTKGDWGMFHEMGHNHQSRDWTFGGTGEVTVNLFSLYVMETVCSDGGYHKAVTPEARAKATRDYIAGGRDFGRWKRSPFLALIMYMQLQEAFGWDAYKKVFSEYRALPQRERPKNDAQKRDQWMMRFSRTVGRNLGPFFQHWGVPVSKQALASIEALPAWMPEGVK